jgi:hypothetical protein
MVAAVYHLGSVVYRHRHAVIGAWAVVFVAALAFIGLVGDNLTSRQDLPGSESVRAGEEISRLFGVPDAPPLQIVLRSDEPLVARRQAVEGWLADVRTRLPGLPLDSPFGPARVTRASRPTAAWPTSTSGSRAGRRRSRRCRA